LIKDPGRDFSGFADGKQLINLVADGVGILPQTPLVVAPGGESDLWENGKTANVLRALTLV
jgi:hypothetical protein